jgi:hypothetical protein
MIAPQAPEQGKTGLTERQIPGETRRTNRESPQTPVRTIRGPRDAEIAPNHRALRCAEGTDAARGPYTWMSTSDILR